MSTHLDLSSPPARFDFGRICRKQRESMGLNISDMATLCEISNSYMRMIEHGDRIPGYATLTTLLTNLDGTFTDLDGVLTVTLSDEEPFTLCPPRSRARSKVAKMEELMDRLERAIVRLEALEK